MLKNNLLILMPVIMLAFLIGCAAPGVKQKMIEKNNAETLPNGTVITASEKAVLESLQSQVNQIFTDVLGDARAKSLSSGSKTSISLDEINQIKTLVKALTKNKLGSGYEKFFIEKNMMQGVSNLSDNASKKVNASYDRVIGQYYAYGGDYCTLYMHIQASTYSTPWFSLNIVYQNYVEYVTSQYNGATTAAGFAPAFQKITVTDSMNPAGFTYTGSGKYELYGAGSVMSGWYPTIPMTTYHTVIDAKANVYFYYYWQ